MSNSGITLLDVRKEAFETIKALKDKSMDVRIASEIGNHLRIVIDVAKTQVEFLKALPAEYKAKLTEESIKSVVGTIRDKDAENDSVLSEINKIKPKFLDDKVDR